MGPRAYARGQVSGQYLERVRIFLLILLASCAKPARAPQPSEVCVLRGKFRIAPSSTLFFNNAPRLRFRGVPVSVEAKVIAAKRVPVLVRTSETGPSLRFEGMLDVSDLPLRSTRALSVVPGHLWIAAGAPVRVLPGISLSTVYSEGLEDVVARGTCDAMTLSASKSPPVLEKGSPHHLANATFALFDAPNGRLLRELRPSARDVFTLWVTGVEKGYAHVVRTDWISIDGWVKQTDLITGEAADCDDCRGSPMDIEDMCPNDDGESDADGCPDAHRAIAHIEHETDVVDDKGMIVGHAEAGTEVFILERKNSRARIITAASPILPVATGWWVAESALKLQPT